MDARDYARTRKKNCEGNYHTLGRRSALGGLYQLCLTKLYFLVRGLPAVINGLNSYLLAPSQSLWEPSKNIFSFYCPGRLASSFTTQLGGSGPVCVFLLSVQEYYRRQKKKKDDETGKYLKGNPAGHQRLLPYMVIS